MRQDIRDPIESVIIGRPANRNVGKIANRKPRGGTPRLGTAALRP